jgi:peptidoglycan/LPS O-acetylase OafA/YrhL
MKNYLRFGSMILTSTIIMYVLMYLNTYSFDHVVFSETRVYMAFMMGAAMAVIMLTFMLKMYTNRKINTGIYIFSVVLFSVCLFLVRSQLTVNDTSWMRAMIPHHSIAILTSERANFRDPRVMELADEIIKTQREEIAEMKALIKDLEEQ